MQGLNVGAGTETTVVREATREYGFYLHTESLLRFEDKNQDIVITRTL